VNVINLAQTLDAVADRLESLGMIKEATEVDVISNTLELDAVQKGTDEEIFSFFKKQYDDAREQNLQKGLCYQNAFNMTAVAYHVSNADLNRILKENNFIVK